MSLHTVTYILPCFQNEQKETCRRKTVAKGVFYLLFNVPRAIIDLSACNLYSPNG